MNPCPRTLFTENGVLQQLSDLLRYKSGIDFALSRLCAGEPSSDVIFGTSIIAHCSNLHGSLAIASPNSGYVATYQQPLYYLSKKNPSLPKGSRGVNTDIAT